MPLPSDAAAPAARLARRLRRALAAWVMATAAGGAEPLPASFRRLALPDDVPAQLCTALAQDAAGFLWIGTQGGLVRYDGYSHRVHRADPADPATLGGSYVRSLRAGRDGRLWVGTFSGGLSVFDPATETFRRYRHDPADPRSLAHDRVEDLAEDGAGRLWIATDQGLDRLDPDGVLHHFKSRPGDPAALADDRVRAVLVDRRGAVWVGSRGGLQRWRGEDLGFEAVAPAAFAGRMVNELFEDSRGRLWAGTTEHGAAVLDAASATVLKLLPPRSGSAEGLSHYWIYGFAEAGGSVWVATFGGGLDRVDATDLSVSERLRHAPSDPASLPGDRVGALLRDRSGLLWVGTWGQGLALHDPSQTAFRALRQVAGDPASLSHPAVVRALDPGDGTLWAGTNGNGIDVLDAGGRRIGGFRPRPGDPGALADGSVTCLALGPDGSRWVGTLDGTLHRLRSGSRRFERLGPAQGLPRGAIRAMAFGPDGALWVGHAEGMARVDPQSLAVRAFQHREGDPRSLSGNAVEALAFTPDGTLWVGTSSGLNAFEPAAGTAVRIQRTPGRPDSLPDNWVPDLLVARDGRLWVATQAGACVLVSWDGSRAAFEAVAPRLGLPPAPVEALVEDRQGRIWMGPRLRLDPAAWKAEAFGPADGCAFRTFFIASRARSADGKLLFGSPEGLLLVSPGRIAPWTFDAPLAVSALRLDGMSRPAAAALAGLRLEPGTRGFALDVAALDFTDPARNRYRHRLEGLDPDWIEVDAARRTLVYAGLRPGRYILRVEGTNRSGRWSPLGLAIPVRVLPAFWQTLGFRLMAGVVVLGLAAAAMRWRVRTLEARGRALEALVSARTRDLAEANAELAKSQEKIAELLASSPDLLQDLEGWTRRMLAEISAFCGCSLAAVAFTDTGPRTYGASMAGLPSLDSLAKVTDSAVAADGRLLLPARGPSGETVGVVVAGGGLAAEGPAQRLLEGFAHQFGAALEMLRVRSRLQEVEASQARTLQEFHARGIPTLQVCTRCGLCTDHLATRCPADGGRLEVPRALPFRFQGRYRFVRRLGVGGMGAVFEAEDEKLSRRVAIKLIRPELAGETAYRLRFEREAQAIARVEHAGVLTLYDSGATGDGQLYLITEFLRGMDVATALRSFGRARPSQAATFLRQGSQALQAAHDAGVVHRDLKPLNVFLVPHPEHGFQVKILDFGLAKAEGFDVQLTGTGLVLGTPAYMAPEQLRRGQADARTDLYAFAAVAYEVLTRKPLVPPERVQDLMRGAWRLEVRPPGSLVPGLPPEVDALFARALAEDPDARPARVAVWGEEAARLLEGVEAHGGWPDVMPLRPGATPFTDLEADPPTRARP